MIDFGLARGPIAGRRDLITGERVGRLDSRLLSLAEVLGAFRKGDRVATVCVKHRRARPEALGGEIRLSDYEYRIAVEHDGLRIYGTRSGLDALAARVAERGGHYHRGALVALR